LLRCWDRLRKLSRAMYNGNEVNCRNPPGKKEEKEVSNF